MATQEVITDEIYKADSTLGITGSPSNTISISMDIVQASRHGSILGQMVYFVINEGDKKVAVVGQVISIETRNRWHEDPAFKGVIRLHGSLPHLSGQADNRIATVSVQSAYELNRSEPKSFRVSNSPSSGIEVKKMSNEAMSALMKMYEGQLTYMGTVYGTSVDMPQWFRHFGVGEKGAGDAHHIAVFGKSGSGKSVTAAYMLRGFSKNADEMSILFLDPQRQFSLNKGLPKGFDFKAEIEKLGMKYEKYEILNDISLPENEFELFTSMLQKSEYFRKVLRITTPDKMLDAESAVAEMLEQRYESSEHSQANLSYCAGQAYSLGVFKYILEKFSNNENRYSRMIYAKGARLNQFCADAAALLDDENITELQTVFEMYWQPIVKFFSNNGTRLTIDAIVEKVSTPGNFVILDISAEAQRLKNDSIQAMFVRLIENRIKIAGEMAYADNKQLNCLIVMDEAHRFISTESSDNQIRELTKEIIDSVRTTRKYGIGYMFITQTIESLDEEILRQTRIFAFGYGLTLGSEIRVIQNLVGNKEAIELYKSFIDPSSSGSYPFMFYGSVSPLSFTGAPLFVEMYNDPSKFQ